MVTRLALLATIAALIAGFLLAVTAMISGDFRLGIRALAAFALAVAAHATGRIARRHHSSRSAPDPVGKIGANDTQTAELIGLLRELDELEQRRGSPKFDPWAVQSLRHDIRAIVDQNPSLERLLRN